MKFQTIVNNKIMKNNTKGNLINSYAPKLKDTLHADGSKTYETWNYGYLTIKNPVIVKLIEKQLSINGFGWYYMDAIQKFVDEGKDIYNEFEIAIRILD